ncbi:calcium/sodium antiporter [Ruminococcus gauvreauii]|uniref:Calcium/sodium antiporter n=1 Tax=Ruminococcus gauvreauii TaxID=438033 RepID=A0ABY5VJ26_9FIRM|nr:calcium/sodium antiporter [Ruminococcus gauvreauii]UWP60570.1 calcium/sodium antiporter [Ruminococcus gauvreauii]
MVYILLIIGFLLLIKGADFFVEGSSSVARLLKVPPVVIGLTIVAMGTSAPEASVSITAGLSGNNDIALSNVIGSNIFNLLVVIGASAVIRPFQTDREIMKRDIPVNIAASVLLLFLLWDLKLGRFEGILLLILLAAYLVWIVAGAVRRRADAADEVQVLPPLKSAVYIAVGLAAIIWGGDLVVDSASEIARIFGMSQTLIGLTIVALGTSLPELVTSVVASRKGESGLALGNAVGSCLFNILFILGMSSSLSPLGGIGDNLIDIGVLIAVSAVIAVCCFTGKKVTRLEGLACIVFYIGYMSYAIIR